MSLFALTDFGKATLRDLGWDSVANCVYVACNKSIMVFQSNVHVEIGIFHRLCCQSSSSSFCILLLMSLTSVGHAFYVICQYTRIH